jgi:hypothetical protein
MWTCQGGFGAISPPIYSGIPRHRLVSYVWRLPGLDVWRVAVVYKRWRRGALAQTPNIDAGVSVVGKLGRYGPL